MKYVCLVYHEESKLLAVSEDELVETMNECAEWVGELEKHGNHIFSHGLQSPRAAMTLRSRDGNLSVTDGPFSETKEFLGGFTIFEARDLNEALQVATKFPAIRLGSAEIRPLLENGLASTDPVDRKIVSCMKRAFNHS